MPNAGLPIDLLQSLSLFDGIDMRSAAVSRIGGRTNRIYRIATADKRWIVRVPGEGTAHVTDRSNEFYNLRLAYEAGFAPAPLYSDANHGILIMPDYADAFLTLEAMKEAASLLMIGRFLRRLHDSRLPFVPNQDLLTAFKTYVQLSQGCSPSLTNAAPIFESYLSRAEPSESNHVGCHGDPGPGNFMQAGDHLLLIDWEYSVSGSPWWDLAIVCDELGLDKAQTDTVLRAYGITQPDEVKLKEYQVCYSIIAAAWAAWRFQQTKDASFFHKAERRVKSALKKIMA